MKPGHFIIAMYKPCLFVRLFKWALPRHISVVCISKRSRIASKQTIKVGRGYQLVNKTAQVDMGLLNHICKLYSFKRERQLAAYVKGQRDAIVS